MSADDEIFLPSMHFVFLLKLRERPVGIMSINRTIALGNIIFILKRNYYEKNAFSVLRSFAYGHAPGANDD